MNDVFSDVRTLVSDDAALEVGILGALREYNGSQLTVAELNGAKVLITNASKISHTTEGNQERHLDPTSGNSFAFDHMRVVSNHSPAERSRFTVISQTNSRPSRRPELDE